MKFISGLNQHQTMASRGLGGMLHRGGVWVLWLALIMPVAAEKFANWRVFKAADGLRETPVTSITVSPRGTVWVRHMESRVLGRLDGYQVTQIPAPEGSFRIHESKGGQIWSLYAEGLQEFQSGKWVNFPIREIRAENQADPVRRVRQIPLLPLDDGRVLVLLSEQLIAFHSRSNVTTTIVAVEQTSLDRFLDMTLARDGGLWLSGRRGIYKVPRAALDTNTVFTGQECLFEDDLRVENGLRPVEDEAGGVMLVADSLTTRKRISLYYDGRQWKPVLSLAESLRQSWRGSDNSIWGLTVSTLLRLEEGPQALPAKEDLSSGQLFDTATETNGVFWVATMDGLYRHAPPLWQTPPEIQHVNSLVHSIRQDREGRLWLISASALGLLDRAGWKLFGFEEGADQFFQPAGAPFFLPSGQVALNINEQLHLFNLKTEEFTPAVHPGGRYVKGCVSLERNL